MGEPEPNNMSPLNLVLKERDGKGQIFKVWEAFEALLLGLKTEEATWQGIRGHLKSDSCPWTPASNETGTSVLQQEWAWIFTQNVHENSAPVTPWFQLYDTLSREPNHRMLDFWPAELWANQLGLFWATEFVEICYTAIDNYYTFCWSDEMQGVLRISELELLKSESSTELHFKELCVGSQSYHLAMWHLTICSVSSFLTYIIIIALPS